MFKELRDYTNADFWNEFGDVRCTQLAEAAAITFDHPEWLDDETHWVWDLAVDIGATAEESRSAAEKAR